jgi:hypothetical protein
MGYPVKNALIRLEMISRLTTNPQYSVALLALQKVRVLLVYLARSMLEWKQLHKAHQHSKKARGAYAHKDALIIAGGPSVNNLNVAKVLAAQTSGEIDVFALNWFPLSDLAKTLVPNFFCLSDPLNRPGSETTFKGHKSEKIWNYLNSHPQIKLILPHNWMKHDQTMQNKVEIWIDDRELVGWSRSNSVLRSRGYSSITAHKTIAAAIHMGYRTIYLIGLDNSVFKNVVVNERNELGDGPSHFYDSNSTSTLIHNKHTFPFGMQDYLYNHSAIFQDLRHSFFDISIVNLDKNSITDVFQKSESQFVQTQQ